MSTIATDPTVSLLTPGDAATRSDIYGNLSALSRSMRFLTPLPIMLPSLLRQPFGFELSRTRKVMTGVARSPRTVEVAEGEAAEVLPGWDYADAFECRWPTAGAEGAMTVAQALLGPSRSARRVLSARDWLVAPFGLRPAHQGDALLFPIQESGPDRVVCGMDDRHLDFRVIVTLTDGVARCTTVVHRHGFLGATYFSMVRPFHRRLVPHQMRRAAGIRHQLHTEMTDSQAG